MAINPNSLEYQYRKIAGSDANNQKATYAVEFSSGGQNYTFIPDSVINQGVQTDKAQFVMPWFLKNENLGKLGDVGQRLDLSGVSWFGDYLKDTVGASTTGFLVPSGSVGFDSEILAPPLEKGKIKGVANTQEGLAYVMDTPEGTLGRYLPQDGKITTLTKTGGSSLFGDVLGGWFDDLTAATGIQDVAGDVNAFFQTPIGKAVLLASAVAGSGALNGSESSAVGSVYGPDNIDVGGGFNPAAPVTAETITNTIVQSPAAEQVAAEQAAVQQAIAEQSAPITAETITSQIAPEVNLGTATAGDIAMAVDPVAANIATGMSAEAAAALAAEQAAADLASQEAARIAAENAAMDAALQDLANSASPVFATSAAAQGLTLKQGLDAVRAGLLINAITGDPLGLNDVVGKDGNTFANQGFAQVPIPEGWKSPEYTYTPVQNVSFEDLFPGVSLQGTQWQNMPQAQTFNQLFAAGQQQTPMGSPVNINQIVGSILGQSTTG